MRLPVLALALVCAMSAAGCSRAQDDKFGEQVRVYLLKHPEVIKEAIDKYNANMQAKELAQNTAAIAQNRAAIERDPRDFVANPGGAVTVTEFYDYRCPHCVNVAPAVLDFVAKNPDVRFVFKEMPIFGAASERAAMAALAIKAAGGDYMGAHRDMMAARPLDAAAVARISQAHGLDPAILDQPDRLKPFVAHLAETHALATRIGVEGTPAFIIGETIVPGEDMEAVQAAVADLRTKGGLPAAEVAKAG